MRLTLFFMLFCLHVFRQQEQFKLEKNPNLEEEKVGVNENKNVGMTIIKVSLAVGIAGVIALSSFDNGRSIQRQSTFPPLLAYTCMGLTAGAGIGFLHIVLKDTDKKRPRKKNFDNTKFTLGVTENGIGLCYHF